MTEYSIIDYGIKDFLRDESGDPIIIEGYFEDAEDWLMRHGENHGWTNQGVKYFDWNE